MFPEKEMFHKVNIVSSLACSPENIKQWVMFLKDKQLILLSQASPAKNDPHNLQG